MLEVLVRNQGKLVSQRQLLQEVWGPQYETETEYLRVYLAALRRKLEPDAVAAAATSSPSRAWATASAPDTLLSRSGVDGGGYPPGSDARTLAGASKLSARLRS